MKGWCSTAGQVQGPKEGAEEAKQGGGTVPFYFFSLLQPILEKDGTVQGAPGCREVGGVGRGEGTTGMAAVVKPRGQGLEEGRKRADASPRGGIGLRNMQERMEQLNGAFTVISSSQGTTLEARAPLSHMLPPEPDSRKTPQETEDVPS